MGKKDRGRQFNVGNPKEKVDGLVNELSKYKIGETGYSFFDIKQLKPVFAFDYLSLSESDLCYNSKKLKFEDLVGFLAGLKKISEFSYNYLRTTRNFRFHPIDFDDKKVSIKRSDFKRILTFKEVLLPDEQLPTLYQIDIQYQIEARICGFLYKGIFYIVWYDRDHIIYPQNN